MRKVLVKPETQLYLSLDEHSARISGFYKINKASEKNSDPKNLCITNAESLAMPGYPVAALGYHNSFSNPYF